MSKTYNQLNAFYQDIVDEHLEKFHDNSPEFFKTRSSAIDSFIDPKFDPEVHACPDFDESRHMCVRETLTTFYIVINDELFVDVDGSMSDNMFAGYEWPVCIEPIELKWDMWRVSDKEFHQYEKGTICDWMTKKEIAEVIYRRYEEELLIPELEDFEYDTDDKTDRIHKTAAEVIHKMHRRRIAGGPDLPPFATRIKEGIVN